MPIPPQWREKTRTAILEFNSSGVYEQSPLEADRVFDQCLVVEPAKSWEGVLGWLEELKGSYYFRGQSEASWSLDTPLDRAAKVEYSAGNHNGYKHQSRKGMEQDLLYSFQQQAHNHTDTLPARDDRIRWLSMMQHFGVPTRLLDWTKSPFVALFFALEEPTKEPESENKSALWAIDLDWLARRAHEVYERAGVSADDPNAKVFYLNRRLLHTSAATFNESGGMKPDSIVVEVNPSPVFSRMAAQQGLFLCKLVDEIAFTVLLVHMMCGDLDLQAPVVRKLEIAGDLRVPFLNRLQQMNINKASLFPGPPELDVLGKSHRLAVGQKTERLSRDIESQLAEIEK